MVAAMYVGVKSSQVKSRNHGTKLDAALASEGASLIIMLAHHNSTIRNTRIPASFDCAMVAIFRLTSICCGLLTH